MIGTISIECNAKNPNMPLHPLRAYINSPSSLRITNVPRKIGKWNINKVTIVAIYPDSTSQTAECVLTGGVWVGTIEGSTTAGTYTQGYTIFADGTDENGNAVTGYVLGKGDIVIMQSDGVPEPEPATIFVKLQDDGTGAEDGDIYPTENGYMIQQNGEAHQLGTPFEQIMAYVDSQVSSKADLSAVPTKTSDLSNDSGFITTSEVSALNTSPATDVKVCIDSNGDLVEKKLIDQTGVWYVKGIYNGSTQIYDFWTPMPTLNETILSGMIQDKAGKYLPVQWSTEVSEATTEKVFGFVYHGRGIRILVKKSEANEIPFEIETGRITFDYNHYPVLSVSQLSNDSGFITSADIPTPSYIEDANGSSISADRSFITVTQLSGVWQLQYGVTTNTLHGQSKTNMSYFPTEPALGDNGFQLTWGIHSSEYWTLEVYTYNSSWSQTGQYDSEAATSDATELVFPNTSVQECIYEEPRIVETGKLATQDWVQAKISAKADLSALSTKADLSALADKQDKLTGAQISAIDSVVDERATVFNFGNNDISAFNWIGEINQQLMISAGLVESTFNWIKEPIEIKVGNAVTNIGVEAFHNCTDLTNIVIPNSVTAFGTGAFSYSPTLSNLTVPESVLSIGADAFFGDQYLSVLFKEKSMTQLSTMANYPWSLDATTQISTFTTASQEWVLAQLAVLQARIAVLENNQ